MLFAPKTTSLAVVAVLAVAAAGCSRKIGDDCSTGTDCSPTGDRTCDTTMPSGYCTIPNCDPDRCPEEAACIAFVVAPSTASQCKNLYESRGIRSFCMRRCSSDGDCRGGYVCRDLNAAGNAYGAERIDKSSSDGRVCTLEYAAYSAIQHDTDGSAISPDAGVSFAGDFCTEMTPFRNTDGTEYYAVGGSSSLGSSSSAQAGNAGAAGATSVDSSGGGSGGVVGTNTTNVSSAGSAGVGQSSNDAAGATGADSAGAQP